MQAFEGLSALAIVGPGLQRGFVMVRGESASRRIQTMRLPAVRAVNHAPERKAPPKRG